MQNLRGIIISSLRIGLAVISGAMLLSILSGCRGPVGPPGTSASGTDTVPPTVQLVRPWPLSTLWDEVIIEANAVDNVAIESVTFSIDGFSLVENMLLIKDKPPFSFTIPADMIGRGWHIIGARAYDVAGNATDAPLIPINVAFTEDLPGNFLPMKYHNDVVATEWVIPDTLFKASAFWSRFTTPDSCEFDRMYVWFGGSIGDSSSVVVELWSGAGVPENYIAGDTLYAEDVNGEVSAKHYDFTGTKLLDKRDYFLLLGIANWESGDELVLGADDGQPYWGRSGTRDDDGWQILSERYGSHSNLMMSCDLFFAPVEPDTSSEDEG